MLTTDLILIIPNVFACTGLDHYELKFAFSKFFQTQLNFVTLYPVPNAPRAGERHKPLESLIYRIFGSEKERGASKIPVPKFTADFVLLLQLTPLSQFLQKLADT